VQLPAPVQVTVNVALVVLGDIAPNTAADDAPLNPILPSRVNVQPGAVRETVVAAVLLTQLTPTTTASLDAFAEAVNVNVSPEELAPCCVNIFVWVMLAEAGDQTRNKRIRLFVAIAVKADSPRLSVIARWLI
jgi:hypothetical protein